MRITEWLEKILKWIYANNHELAVKDAEYTLKELDSELNIDPKHVCLAEYIKQRDDEMYLDLLDQFYTYQVDEVDFVDVTAQELKNLIYTNPAFPKEAYKVFIPFDSYFSALEMTTAKRIVKTISESINLDSNSDAFSFAAYANMAVQLNWVGIASGYKEFSDGKREDAIMNLLLMHRDRMLSLVIYDPINEKFSPDGRFNSYRFISGGVVVWG